MKKGLQILATEHPIVYLEPVLCYHGCLVHNELTGISELLSKKTIWQAHEKLLYPKNICLSNVKLKS